MKGHTHFKLRLITIGILAASVSLPSSAQVFSPLSTDITEPTGIYPPLSAAPLRADVTTVIGTGPCQIDNYSGCTLTDVDNDINGRDYFKPEIKVHLIMDTFPDDGKITNATLRQRGNSSRFADQKSYRIKLDSKRDLWRGERKLQLNKHPFDLSRLANKLSFDLIQDIPHLPSLRTDFVNFYIDNVDYGLFTHVESVGKEYLTRRGWDKHSGLYKADHFDFVMSELYKLDSTGKPLDPHGFKSKLKIERGKDHRKLLEMLGAVNNANNNFSSAVMNKYFNKNNYLSWISVNLLFGNKDAVGIDADNFYLLNRKGKDTFYFLPWDYDEAWLDTPWEVQNNIHQSRAWTGVSAYWSSLLHRRYLKQPGAITELRSAVEHIKNTHLSSAKIANKLNAYLPIIQPLVSSSPDVDNLPVSGSIPTMDEFLNNHNNMFNAVQKNYQVFIDSIQYPMGFWIKTVNKTANKLTLEWSSSYDLQGDSITYDVQLATSPDFSASTIVGEVTGLTTTQYEYNWNLPQNNYYIRILARDSANPENHWQVAFNEYEANNREYHGVVALQNTPPPAENAPICETGADPKTIKLGEGTALWWWTENATSGVINNDIGSVALPSNYKWISPTQTTTYTMTAKGDNGETSSCKTTVVVNPNNSALTPLCALGADPQIINAGEGTALWWWTENAASASINQGIDNILLPTNYRWIHPTQTTTYTINTVGTDGTAVTCNTLITVR